MKKKTNLQRLLLSFVFIYPDIACACSTRVCLTLFIINITSPKSYLLYFDGTITLNVS